MKKLILMSVSALTFLVGNPTFGQIDPSINIEIYATVCPAIEAPQPVWNTWVGSAQSFWLGTVTESPTVDPANVHFITQGKWEYICVDPAGSFAMWLGKATPGGPQRGNGISFPMQITASNGSIRLTNMEIALISWDGPNSGSLGRVQVLSSYFPEARGVQSDGTFITSGSSMTPVKKIQYLGPRAAYAASSQAGINLISNYVASVAGFGISCRVKVFRDDGTLAAIKQLDVPFNPARVRLTQLDASTLYIAETNRQYRLQSTTTVSTNSDWIVVAPGLPVFGGKITVPASGPKRFYRAYQND